MEKKHEISAGHPAVSWDILITPKTGSSRELRLILDHLPGVWFSKNSVHVQSGSYDSKL